MPIICAGVASADITPPVGVELAGGAFGASTGVLHPLTAQALFLTDGFTSTLLISADLVGFDTAYAEDIRTAIASRCSIPAANVMLAATHTHNGPATACYRNWGAPDAAYRKGLQRQLVGLAARASASTQPVEIAAGYGECAGIAENRVVEGGPVDEQLGVLRLDTLDGRPLAALVNYACHPVTLHCYQGLISPDFPHLVRMRIREALNPDMEVFYLTGTAGDLNPTGFIFGETDACLANFRRTGSTLGAAAVQSLQFVPVMPADRLACVTAECQLPLAPLPSAEELEALIARDATHLPADHDPTNWEDCETKTRLEWAREALAFVRSGQPVPPTQTILLQAMQIGPAAIVAIPGELFHAFGRQIKDASPLPLTIIVEQANGSEGYFPDEHAYAIGHYEATRCPMYCGIFTYRPEVGAVVTEGCLSLLRQLAG